LLRILKNTLLYSLIIVSIKGCAAPSQKVNKNYQSPENKIPMRTWLSPPDKIFSIVLEIVRKSFPRSKIRENREKNRIHFWYFDSEQEDSLIIMEISSQDLKSTLYLFPPRYGVRQPLFIRDPVPLKHFFENLDDHIQAFGIPVIFKNEGM